jgi:hypothetical protein
LTSKKHSIKKVEVVDFDGQGGRGVGQGGGNEAVVGGSSDWARKQKEAWEMKA